MSVAKGGVLITVVSYLCLAIGVVQTMILSRALGPEGVGQLTLFRQLFLLGVQISSLGLPMAMIRAINTKQVPPYSALRIVQYVCLLLSLFAVIVISSLLFLGESFFRETTPIIFCSMFIWIPTNISKAVYYNFSAALLRAKAMAIISFFPLLISVLAYLVLWKFFLIKVERALLVEALTLGAFGLLLAWRLNVFPVGWSVHCGRTEWYGILRNVPFGLQLVATDILVLANASVLLGLLRWLSDDFKAVGYFTRGLSIATLTVVSVQALQRYIYAEWSRWEPSERVRKVEQTVNISIMFVLTIGVGIVLFARELTVFLFGPAFLPAVSVTRITLVGAVVYVVAQLLQSFFNASGKAIYNIAVLLSGLLANILAGFLLIRPWAEIGCSYAFLTSCIVMAVVSVWIGCAKLNLNWRTMFIPKPELVQEVLKSVRKG